ncbi:MarR family winged helix-turn-helix transcriptional regulator [Chelativorans intermedius]|uniref:MarR family winged helix-turn-helix transcriptional regulator n=1 Tax=Chelativorans intermedius TaxID=515947 RepID=A0ABV6D7Q8_9HYPH|nr:MarR family transcriptional regulator [Chelativorans intermedius]MCT8999793.1 MarR family transcriptional regulator [Chelativorans intermedius]
MTNDVLILEDFMPYRLNRLADAISREFARIYRDRYGLTRPEWRTLAALGQHGTMTATEIGAHSAMHKTKVSRAVAALEKRRWLVRKADANDRRVERLSLTKAGQRVYGELIPVAAAFEAGMLDKLGARQREAVLKGLAALEKAVLRA